MSKPDNDVIVVGAGIAGISVAYHLLMNNFDGNVVVVEARDRIGGRIVGQPTKYQHHHVELGANWIHGIMGNPIYQAAVKHQIIDPLAGAEEGRHVVEARTCTGKSVDISLVEEVYRVYFYFVKRCESYFQLKDTETPTTWNNSVGQHLKEDIDSWLDKQKEDDETICRLKNSVFKTLLNRETCISGCHSMDEVSLSDFGSYTELPGGNVTVPKGYHRIIAGLLDEINAKLATKSHLSDAKQVIDKNFRMRPNFSILKNHRVVKVKWTGVGQSQGDGLQEVVCENGSTFKARHVVVTLPLGVLKQEAELMFEPKLPQYKLDCIKSLGFGVVNKIFLEYRDPINTFIDDNVNELLLLFDDDEEDENDPTENWYRKIYSITKITNHCLLGWVSGQQAQFLEQMTCEQINAQLTQMLRKFLANQHFPEADQVTVTKWMSDPFCRGSYSFVHKNSSNKDIELLGQPIYADPANEKPVLLFAGEATHTSFYSTVHGAFLSGKRSASYLLDPDVVEGSHQTDEESAIQNKFMCNIVSGLFLP